MTTLRETRHTLIVGSSASVRALSRIPRGVEEELLDECQVKGAGGEQRYVELRSNGWLISCSVRGRDVKGKKLRLEVFDVTVSTETKGLLNGLVQQITVNAIKSAAAAAAVFLLTSSCATNVHTPNRDGVPGRQIPTMTVPDRE